MPKKKKDLGQCEEQTKSGWVYQRKNGLWQKHWGTRRCRSTACKIHNGKAVCYQHGPKSTKHYIVVKFFRSEGSPESACGHHHRSLKAAIACAKSEARGCGYWGDCEARVEEVLEDGKRKVVHTATPKGLRITLV